MARCANAIPQFDSYMRIDLSPNSPDFLTWVAAYGCRCGKPFPQVPKNQLWGAVGAVFGSWMNQRTIICRRLNDIPESWGVAFTRNPSTGAHELYGEFLVNAQGEDVVAGIRVCATGNRMFHHRRLNR